MRGMMSKLKLTVNETKTRLCRLPEETFDFLGYTLGRNYDRRTGPVAYVGPRRSRKKINRLCGEISALTKAQEDDLAGGREADWSDQPQTAGLVPLLSHRNRQLGLPPPLTVTSAIGCTRWLCNKFKVPGQGRTQYPDAYLYQELGLHDLERT